MPLAIQFCRPRTSEMPLLHESFMAKLTKFQMVPVSVRF